MKPLLLALALASCSASAAGWEYGFLTEAQGILIWDTPQSSVDVRTGLFSDLNKKLKCKGQTWFDFYNCVGGQGWEFTGQYSLNQSDKNALTYIFKRPKR